MPSFLYSTIPPVQFDRILHEKIGGKKAVLAILQDKQGFIWMGTYSGLKRYDGINCIEYTRRPKDSNSLSSDVVRSIYQDKSERLWVGTEGGLNLFNPRTKNFNLYYYKNKEPNQPPLSEINNIMSIFEGPDGLLWIGTFGGLIRFDPATEAMKLFTHIPGTHNSLSNNRISQVFVDSSGIVWLATQNGLNKFDPKSDRFTHYKSDKDSKHSLSHNRTSAILEDSQGRLWVGTNDGLDMFDRDTERFVHFSQGKEKADGLSDQAVRTIFEDNRRNIWIGTRRGGLNRLLSFREKTFTHYVNRPGDQKSLSNNHILCLAGDNVGAIWIGTSNGGVNRIETEKRSFSHFLGSTDSTEGIANDVVSFYEDPNGMVWIGTLGGGLIHYDPKRKTFDFHKAGANSGQLNNNDILCIKQDQKGNLWLGTWGGGLNRFDPESGTFTAYKSGPNATKSPSSNNIFSLYITPDNQLWLGTWKAGLNMFDLETEVFTYYKNDPDNSNTIAGQHITVIYPDEKNRDILWLGTQGSGLDQFNRKTKHFTHYSRNQSNPETDISDNFIQSIYISPNHPHIVWVGTYGGGLNRFNQTTNEWYFYTVDEGLPSNSVYGILGDKDNNLWISTNKGISRFNPTTETFKNYNTWDGLQSNEFNQGAFHKGVSGCLYFGGINGFNAFFPMDITDNPHPPPVVITSFKKYIGNALIEEEIPESGEITITYEDMMFLEFAALNFRAPAKNQYAFKLISNNKPTEWTQLGNKHELNFKLPHGEHLLTIIGSNNDNVWNKTGTSLRIIVTPPFWETNWFKYLVLFSIAALIFTFYKFRVRQYKAQKIRLENEVSNRTKEIKAQKDIIEKKTDELIVSYAELKRSEENLRELNATKDKLFSIISHDLRNPITALMGHSTMLSDAYEIMNDEKRLKYITAMNRSVEKLYDLLENLLNWAKSQQDGLESKPENIKLNTIIPETLSIYGIIARKKNIGLLENVESNLLAFADKNMVEAVLRNLISNAIKFTKSGGSVTVIAKSKEDFVEISVSDTGIGVSAENIPKLFATDSHITTKGTDNEKGTGLGLILCREFVEANNGKIRYEKGNKIDQHTETGSTFIFTLPKHGFN